MGVVVKRVMKEVCGSILFILSTYYSKIKKLRMLRAIDKFVAAMHH